MEFGTTYHIINRECHSIPVVISIPHSGIFLPEGFRSRLKDGVVLPNSDWYLPELYSFLEGLGYTGIVNHVNRYVIDVNRSLQDHEGDSYKTNLCFNHTTQGYAMYDNPLTDEEIRGRIDAYYLPYHRALEELVREKKARFGAALVLDLHSFGLDYGADVILGNRMGRTCSLRLTDFFRKELQEQGLSVNENEPYCGGYITRHYGLDVECCQALQLELWYQAYIEKRDFGNEELPAANRTLFRACQEKLRPLFLALASRAEELLEVRDAL